MPISFDFNTDYQLENEFVFLRPLTVDDHKHLSFFSEKEPELWTYSLIRADSPTALANYLEMACEERRQEKSYAFIVFDKKTGRYAGSTRFYDMQLNNKTLQVGYTWYGKQFQGTGLNKNCKFLLLQFAFDIHQLERVEFRADENNSHSIAAMKSIGCVEEGTLRNNCPTAAGGRRNSIVFSILKAEWELNVKENLQKKIEQISNSI
jgi:N-acetyltransferase